jgi:hypothetical protein
VKDDGVDRCQTYRSGFGGSLDHLSDFIPDDFFRCLTSDLLTFLVELDGTADFGHIVQNVGPFCAEEEGTVLELVEVGKLVSLKKDRGERKDIRITEKSLRGS